MIYISPLIIENEKLKKEINDMKNQNKDSIKNKNIDQLSKPISKIPSITSTTVPLAGAIPFSCAGTVPLQID